MKDSIFSDGAWYDPDELAAKDAENKAFDILSGVESTEPSTLDKYSVDDVISNTDVQAPPAFLEERKISLEKPSEPEIVEPTPETLETQPSHAQVQPVVNQVTSESSDNLTPLLEKYLKKLDDIVTQDSQKDSSEPLVTENTISEKITPIVLQTTSIIEKTSELQEKTTSLISEVDKSIEKNSEVTDKVISTSTKLETERESKSNNTEKEVNSNTIDNSSTNNIYDRSKEKSKETNNSSIFQSSDPSAAVNSNSEVENNSITQESHNINLENSQDFNSTSNNNVTQESQSNLSVSPISIETENKTDQNVENNQNTQYSQNNNIAQLERTNIPVLRQSEIKSSVQTVQIQTAIQEAIKNIQNSSQGGGITLITQPNSEKTNTSTSSEREVSKNSSEKQVTTNQQIEAQGDGLPALLLSAIHEALVSGTIKVRIES